MWGWYILGALVALGVNALVAARFAEIAEYKGHGENYFWWCFLLGVPGYLMVVALPDIEARPKVEKKSVSSIMHSSHPNAGGVTRSVSQSASSNSWKCSSCGRINANYISTCACGKNKP